MPPLTFLPQLHGLHLDSIAVTGDRIALTVTTVRRTARCPLCQSRSRRMQSRYTRTLMDLPWSGHSVFLQIRCKRRFANGSPAFLVMRGKGVSVSGSVPAKSLID